MRIRKQKGEFKKTCSKCGGLLEENRLGKYRYCKNCHVEYTKTHRIKKPRVKYGIKNNCSKCNKPLEENRLGKNRYCLKCANENTRLNRKRHSELTDEQRKKSNARSYVKEYVKRGKIKKMPCEKCGEKSEMHHEDYSKPLDVGWLCRKHHLEYHKNHK